MSKRPGERYTIAVDFDGVLHAYTSPWVEPHVIPDPPVAGAIAWLNAMGDQFQLAIFTTRGRTALGREAVHRWLLEHGVTSPFFVTSQKIPALIYLDDRAVRFTGPDSFPTVGQVHKLRPWNK